MSIKPATILKLTLLGYILVAIPLTIGLLNTMLQVDRLAAQMQRAVHNSTQAVESGRLITTQALSMERSALQYLVLRDGNILSRYEKQREPFIQEIRRLQALPLDDALAQRLRQLQEHETRLYQKLQLPSDKSTAAEDRLGEEEQLSSLTASIPFDVTTLVSRESRHMNEQIRSVRQLLLWQAAALIPLALLIAVTFSLLISGPLRHLGAAIRQLGAGEFDARIKVNGPQDIRELGEQLDWLRQQLAALNEQKLQFLHHVSHELKTPLTTIREGAGLLQDGIAGDLTPEQQEVVQILHGNSLQLQAQVETLLNFNLALAQEQPPEREMINMAELVTLVVKKHRLALRSRNISVHSRLLPLSVNGDAAQLQTIIDNLLSNAIKFSPDGGEIQIGLRKQNQQLLLDVIDAGAGVPDEDRTRLFEPFFKGKSLSSGPVSGTGLGLSLVKRYLHLHGGSINLRDSTRGAHFQVTLPLAGKSKTMRRQLLSLTPLLLSACAAIQPTTTVPEASPLAVSALAGNVCGNLLDDYETFSLMDEFGRKQRLKSISHSWILTNDSCEQLRLSLLLSQPQGSDKDRQKALNLLKELLVNEKLADPQARQLASLLHDQLQLVRAEKLKTLELHHRLKAQRSTSRELSGQLDSLQSQLQQLKNIEHNINEKEQSIIAPSTDSIPHEPP